MQTSRGLRQTALVVTSFSIVVPAHAGMTVYGLRDVYRLRLEEISFFTFLFLISALALKLLWNYAFQGFAAIPRLKYLQALGLALVFGLVMLLILTMISGIREVLTPGAWRRQGTSYRLNDPSQEPTRKRSLEHLRRALLDYAHSHDGQFPPHDYVPEIPEKLWESPDQAGSHYLYSGGLSTNDVDAILAIEPPNFGERRFVLKTSGEIKMRSNDELRESAGRRAKP
ncbi:MAG TPA: hypothetical protein VFZ59_12030 [Verrucomicrobiae bacterium]|nr:hypothetical protein [Verrucomicrobiae bacterium]